VLRLLAAGCLAAVGLPGLTGCASNGKEEAAPGPVSLDRAEAERAGRTVVTWNRQKVEVRFTGDGFAARSLACTHLGCTVRWEPEKNRYACPCHAGFYDAEGNPTSGPPLKPLREVPVRVAENRVIVGS
jgi:Rieske Fe-S protein